MYIERCFVDGFLLAWMSKRISEVMKCQGRYGCFWWKGKPKKLGGCWHGPFLPEQVLVCFSKKKKKYFRDLLFHVFLIKTPRNALPRPTQSCSWDQRRAGAVGIGFAPPFVPRFLVSTQCCLLGSSELWAQNPPKQDILALNPAHPHSPTVLSTLWPQGWFS